MISNLVGSLRQPSQGRPAQAPRIIEGGEYIPHLSLLRIFIGESDKWHGKPLYEAIILRARELGVAGATMLRGMMGYGAASENAFDRVAFTY